MPRDDSFTNLERDLSRREPTPHHGDPFVGDEIERDGESTAAFPGTGTSLPQDIGADGFEVEAPIGEERDDLSLIDTTRDDETPDQDRFERADINWTPQVDGLETTLSELGPHRPERVDRLDENETPQDDDVAGEMGVSSEISELPIGAEDSTAGELGRYECPNCGFEFDVVTGTRARCPNCNYEADLSNIVGDEAFHFSVDATLLKD